MCSSIKINGFWTNVNETVQVTNHDGTTGTILWCGHVRDDNRNIHSMAPCTIENVSEMMHHGVHVYFTPPVTLSAMSRSMVHTDMVGLWLKTVYHHGERWPAISEGWEKYEIISRGKVSLVRKKLQHKEVPC